MTTLLTNESLTSTQIMVGGNWVDSSNSAVVKVHSPVTEEEIGYFPEITIHDSEKAVTVARGAFDDGRWSNLTVAQRSPYIEEFLQFFDQHADRIAAAWIAEVGVTRTVADAFNSMAAVLGQEALSDARNIVLSERRQTPVGNVEIRHEPIGPVLAIQTYNGPTVEIAFTVLPALLMGNTVIVKLPPENGLTGQLLAQAAHEAGFPTGVLSFLPADTEVSKYLVEHPKIDLVHFTGGTEIGAEIAATCARRIAHVTLELGGKSAAIVADDADLDDILPTLIGGMTPIQGQVCTALTRILVPRDRHDELLERLTSAFAELRIGDPDDPTVDIGPLANKRVWDRTMGYIERAVAEGAEVAFGGKRPDGSDRGWFIEPTLLTNVTNSMEVAQNEIFGPVFVIIPFEDLDDAIEIANDSRYGLAGAVFSRDEATAWQVANKVRVGAFAINGNFPCLAAPFGGVKQSGVGRVAGPEGMFEFTDIKQIVLPPDTSRSNV